MGVYNARITDGTSVLLNLSTSTAKVIEYLPLSGERNIERTNPAPHEGSEILYVVRSNVIEPIRIAVLGDNTTARTVEGALQTLFRRAEHYAVYKEGTPIYWEFELEPGDGFWRSLIYSGDVALETGGLGWQWRGAAVAMSITLERQPFFEGPVAVAGSGSITNGGYVGIGSVSGDLPVRAQIEAVSTWGGADIHYDIWAGHHVWGNPSGFTPSLSMAASPSWSGNGENLLAATTLSSAMLDAAGGSYFRVFVLFSTAPPSNNVWLRWRIRMFGLTILSEGPQVRQRINSSVLDLGVAQLPPYLEGMSSVGSLTFQLTGQNFVSGSSSLGIASVFLMPVNGYRHYKPQGYGLTNGSSLIETLEGKTYSSSGGSKYGFYVPYGSPIYLWPGYSQRVYMLTMGNTGESQSSRSLSATVRYRPRRVIL